MNGGTFKIGDVTIAPGSSTNVSIEVAQTYTGQPVSIRAQVWNASQPGPIVMICGAIHGDEINGAGIVREIIRSRPFELLCGTLVLVPVVNVLGFEQHTRYMPDRRDLNRSFPGKMDGSLTSRFARTFFDEFVRKCHYVIDLHSAAWTRTNFPNVRADMTAPIIADFASSLGSEVVLNDKGPTGSLRMEAVKAGVVTVILEAGEVNKVEPRVVEFGLKTVTNGLKSLGMIDSPEVKPIYQAIVKRSTWIRAQMGGLLDYHVTPGDIVTKGQPIATNMTLLGEEQNVLLAPFSGIVIGMTTLPAVMPGDPVLHLGQISGGHRKILRALDAAPRKALLKRTHADLQTNLTVYERES